MDLLAQGFVGLISLALLGLGAKSMFAPASMLDNFSIDPRGAAGLNTIRGVIGGLFLASLGMLLAGLATGQTLWFIAVAAVLGAVAVGRVVGFVFDGFDKAAAPPLVVEIVMVAILLASHAQLGVS